jgi:hypothetical protein
MSNTFYTWFLLNLPSLLLFLGLLMLITNTAKMGIDFNEERNKYYQSNIASILFIIVSLLLEKFYIPFLIIK